MRAAWIGWRKSSARRASAPAAGVAQFSFSPVDLATSGTITPLGNLAPPGHVLPTDPAYIYAVDFDHPRVTPNTAVRPIVAPALGAVIFILHQPSNDWKIEFRSTEHFYYYLDHVANLDTSLHVGTIVQAGQQVGVTNPGGSIDLGAWDDTNTLPGFVNPKRYGAETLHCVTPWGYFAEPLPQAVTAASGLVAYQLQYTGDRSPYGLMLVQLVNDTTLTVQVFVGSTATTGAFDAGARTYLR